MKSNWLTATKARIMILGFCFIQTLISGNSIIHAQSSASSQFLVLPQDNLYADSAKYYLKFFKSKIEPILGWNLDTLVTLYMADTEDDFRRDVGETFPDWGIGAAISDQAKIVIKSPKFIYGGKSLGELIGHELAHVMLFRAAGKRRLPRWFQEGFAMYISGEWRLGQDILVARAAWTGNLIPLEHMDGLSSFKGPKASLAYTESYLAISSLVRRSDPFLISDFLEQYRNRGDFNLCWRKVTGKDYYSWLMDWFNTISRNYHFLLFMFDSEIFWIVFALAVILFFILKKLQNRRVKKRWEREERLNPPDENYKKYFDGYYDEENKT